MEHKLNELENKVNNHEKLFSKLDQTLEKLASNQEKMIHFEHELNLVKNELKHNVDMYQGKLKGVQELSDKEDNQIRVDITSIKTSLSDLIRSNKSRDWAVIMALASALGGLALSFMGGK